MTRIGQLRRGPVAAGSRTSARAGPARADPCAATSGPPQCSSRTGRSRTGASCSATPPRSRRYSTACSLTADLRPRPRFRAGSPEPLAGEGGRPATRHRRRPGQPHDHRVVVCPHAAYGCRRSGDSPHAVECDLVEDGGVFVAHRPSGAGPPPSQLPSSTAPYARHRTLGGVRSRAPRGSARHPGDDVLGDSPEPDLDRRRATAGRSSTTSRIAAGRSRGAALESAPDAW